MMRWLQLLSVAAAAGAAIFVFQIKYRAEGIAEHAASLQRQVDAEKEKLSLLKAEWSYLVQPSRLQELIELHGDDIDLEPLQPTQITTIADLPVRPAGPAPEDEAALSALFGANLGEEE